MQFERKERIDKNKQSQIKKEPKKTIKITSFLAEITEGETVFLYVKDL